MSPATLRLLQARRSACLAGDDLDHSTAMVEVRMSVQSWMSAGYPDAEPVADRIGREIATATGWVRYWPCGQPAVVYVQRPRRAVYWCCQSQAGDVIAMGEHASAPKAAACALGVARALGWIS